MFLASCSAGYKNDGKEVTWHTWNEGNGHNSRKVDADPNTFEELNDDYGRDKKLAFYRGSIIKGAEDTRRRPTTFRVVDFYIGQDKNRAYQKGKPTQIKDYTKLTQLGRLMYSDGYHIYDMDFRILKDADVSTFEHISDNWYRDKSHVWWSNKIVAEADPMTFQPVPVTSYVGSEGTDFNYGKDNKHVFWNDSIIQGADPESFEKRDFPDGDSWTVFDRNRVYQGKDSPKLREYLKKKYGK